MTLKAILLMIAVPLTAIGTFMARGFLYSATDFLVANPTILVTVIVAIAIQLAGHVLRAMRTKLVIDQASNSSLQFQFGALSIGYLFNTLIPFRVGELVRALVIARRLHISLLYTFTAIVIERATDIIFLGILILFGVLVLGGMYSSGLVALAAVGISISVAILVVLILLKNENKTLLSWVDWLAHLCNPNIANRIRFKVWSLIFGLQSFFNDSALVRKYIGYAILSWLCYFISAVLIIMPLLQVSGIVQLVVSGVSPYIIALNPLDASSYQLFVTLLPVSVNTLNVDMFAKIIWIVLTLPMALAGLIALVMYRPGTKKTAARVSTDPYTNKLMRHRDISQDFPAFLESYFAGNDLAKILHNIEVTGELNLVRFFKGGSDAITILVLSDGGLFVKKIIPLKYRDRLKAQYDWLTTHKKMKYLVKVLGEQDSDDYYAIDLAYDPKNIPYFEYAHHSSLTESKHVLEKVWRALYEHLHDNNVEPEYDPEARDAYVVKHIDSCVEKAASVHADLQKLLKQPTIVINGKEYDNLRQVMKKIKNNKQAWQDIATYVHSPAVHGDPSIDNILVNPNNDKPLIIDPAPDGNIIEGPVFDLGKFSQSFYCGYEFSFRDEDEVRVEGKNAVRYRDHISARYSQLWYFVYNELAPRYVSEAERRAMIFHAGALHLRRLKHQVNYNPGNTLKFYAIGVKSLNEFLEQYERE